MDKRGFLSIFNDETTLVWIIEKKIKIKSFRFVIS